MGRRRKNVRIRISGAAMKTGDRNPIPEKRDKWAKDTCYVYPGPIQYWGPTEVCDQPTKTLALEKA